jgi:glucan phosphoethanolaminetransferase (alkaline phosphatase superfamily)
MWYPQVNYPAVLVTAIAIFALGGLWYSPLLFARRWVALMGKSDDEIKAAAPGPLPFALVFVCAIFTALVMAIILNHFSPVTPLRGLLLGVLSWIGFAAATSFGTATFSGQPRALWLINSGYNLVSFAIAGAILGAWR